MSYVALGGVFTANMTGNTVLLGIALANGRGHDALLSLAALVGFSVGAAVGALVPRLVQGLLLEACALAIAVALAPLGSHFPVIAAAAVAMGMQSATLRDRNRTGVKVTYLTGTLTTFWHHVAGGEQGAGFPAVAWITYAGGGLVGALLADTFGSDALLVPAAIVVVAGALRRTLLRRGASLQA